MGINFKNSRVLGSLILVAAALILLTVKLVQIQVVQHDRLLAESKITNTYKVKIPAARGAILDRNGQELVRNRQGNALRVLYGDFPSDQDNSSRNAVLLNTLNLLESRGEGEKVIQNLPLELDGSGNLVFSADSEREIQNMKSSDLFHLASYATAQDCFNAMVEKYELQPFNTQDALRVGSLRYELSRNGFSYSAPVTIAEDVSSETVLIIQENKASAYSGVTVQLTAYREYVDGTIAPHLLGTTTKMTAELYADLKEKGYGLNDIVGESGIEKAMESYLRGTDGEMTVKVDENGNVTTEITREPVQGRTIVLTIDKELQKVAQDKLAEAILAEGGGGTAGAVVVENVKNGELLAAASYPTYDISRYREDYDSLTRQANLPLLNRYAQGTYAPGSTFKPGMAIAALDTGTITEDYRFTCHGTMEFRGQEFQCQRRTAHGSVNVYEAIEQSCNLFFYNISEQIGIQKMNEYATDLGFGQRTGVEIPEAKGIISGKEYSDSIGANWTAGQVFQSIIGQSYNQTTILQLANYTATIANGGTRYQLHFVKDILSYDCSEVVSSTKSSILETLDLQTNALKIVQDGMKETAQTGSARNLKNITSVPMGAKTGTAEMIVNGEEYNNGFLISYAPADEPEIAIAAVAEHAKGGAYLTSLEGGIAEAYFASSEYIVKPQGFIELLP